ncbi:hypothetical protein Nizo1839_0048 [Lactiplantibacillus plantarum]|nr:hypothetical protein SF2A35B_2966 [Lactiplantibacillus plantarum]KZT83756.1 hypothetical protein Nizo1839_0048 [Lactiplantibacillus plantarum]
MKINRHFSSYFHTRQHQRLLATLASTLAKEIIHKWGYSDAR